MIINERFSMSDHTSLSAQQVSTSALNSPSETVESRWPGSSNTEIDLTACSNTSETPSRREPSRGRSGRLIDAVTLDPDA